MVQGKKVDTIIKRAERALLWVGIGQTVRKVKSLVEKTEILKREVYLRLPSGGPVVEKFVAAYGSQETSTNQISKNVGQKCKEQGYLGLRG